MADTPILNYKGKYDGPEIDKAVELALGLENPESCPYYVHISLSQPDYVLTIGLGDAEGNLFNHAEIDLPLESMVVNATYENGNIILHLQDGTSTEPIPISALIAGLVSETRTIAGIDLKDDITQKELRDALGVYTKDSVDQLVSDLEDRIDETLNEMKQSLNDLSDLTSEHDTQIKKNISDIATNKNAIEVNQRTLGTQITKNILKLLDTINPANGLTVTVNADKSLNVNGTVDSYRAVTLMKGLKLSLGKRYTMSISDINTNITLTIGDVNREETWTPTNTQLSFTPKVETNNVWIQGAPGTVIDNVTLYPMIRSADITDPTYEPYVPSVNERLVSVKNDIAINCTTLGVQCVNIFDGELKNGSINVDTGMDVVNDIRIVSTNYIKVSTNAVISVSRTESDNDMAWRFYDKNKNYIGSASNSNIQVISGSNTANILKAGLKFGCFKIINPEIAYIRFVDTTNSLTNKYMIVEGEYTENTMPVYEPYVPSVNERLTANENDILTAQNQIDTQTLITTSGEVKGKNWYRVFEVSQKGATRTGIILINRSYSNGQPEQYILSINIGYYTSKFNLISRLIEESNKKLIDKIRVVRGTSLPTKNNCYIDIHYNSDWVNTIYASILANTNNDEAFSPVNFSAAEIPEGYTSVEFDLTGNDIFERLDALETALSQTQTQ